MGALARCQRSSCAQAALAEARHSQTPQHPVQANPALRGVIAFPQLTPPPADFLADMEGYVREAPRVVDPNAQARRGSVSAQCRV